MSPRLALLTLLAATLAAPPADACAPFELVMVPLTKDGATLYDDGGFVLTQRADHGRDRENLAMRSGSKVVAFDTEQLAPNLFVMRPKAATSVELVRGQSKISATVQHGSVTPLAAPKVSAVVSSRNAGPVTASYNKVEVSVAEIRLAAAAPPDALALVVIDATSRQGLAWLRPTAGTTAYSYTSTAGGKGCGGPGFSITSVGDRVQLAWLDTGGRLSMKSAPFTVGRK